MSNGWVSEETVVILLKKNTPLFVFQRIKSGLERLTCLHKRLALESNQPTSS